NRVETAFSFIRDNLQKKPDWAEGEAVAGELAAMAGRLQQAETYFKSAVASDPKLIPAWEGLGSVLTTESKYDDALAAFNKALELSPQSASTYLHIGQLHELREQWQLAQASYQKALTLDPGNVIAKNNLAWNYAEHGGNVDVALRLAQEANQARPDDPEICDTLGWIYLKKNAAGAAVQVLKKSVAQLPNNPDYNYHLGLAYWHAGNTALARRLLETALQIQPSSPFAKDAKAILGSMTN